MKNTTRLGEPKASHFVVPGALGALTVTDVEGPDADRIPIRSPNTK